MKLFNPGNTANAAAVILASLALAEISNAQLAHVVSASGDQFETIDLGTGVTISTVPITGIGLGIAHGLARHPGTGVLYGVGDLGACGRSLFTIDPSTGAGTLIGDTCDLFANIAFDATGTLYGVTGWGATVQSTLYTLDLTTGAPTFVLTLSNLCGIGGEAIGFNPDDGLMYHCFGWSGQCAPYLERIDLRTLTVANTAPMTGDLQGEMCSITYFGNGMFIGGNIDDNDYEISTAGVVRFITGPGVNVDQKGVIPVVADDGVGFEVCTANANSLGAPAHIAGAGSDVAGSGNFLDLSSELVPNQPGIFFYGSTLIDIPFGNGRLCASGGIVRLGVVVASNNIATDTLENTAFTVGQTAYFQFWYRDPAAGGANFNTSYALQVMFQ